jgi:hypothetical protein
MTKTIRPVKRETLSQVRERGKLRPIIIELGSTYLTIRLKGSRHSFTATYDQLWKLGAENAAREARRLRMERRRNG